MASSAPNDALTSHLLSRLDADLAFLASQQLLSPSDLALIRSKLAPISASAGTGRGVPPPPPRPSIGVPGQEKAMCRAVWDYNQSQPDDLGFKAGDVIAIEEEVNGDWWKGSLNGQTGLFPCNHVERIASSAPSPATPPPPAGPAPGYNAGYAAQQPSWSAPPSAAPPVFAYEQPQNYGAGNEKVSYSAPPPPPQHQPYAYQGPPPPPPSQQVIVQPAENGGQEKKGKFGKFGGRMGQAVAGGIGFGAGSALASEAVHAIF